MEQHDRIREFINRLARLDAGEAWVGDLNPAQKAVLDYLSRANRFSRSPSLVAEYLGATRGTISQTLKSLGKKGYVIESRSITDKRAISFDLTAKGRDVTLMPTSLTLGLANIEPSERDNLVAMLSSLLASFLEKNQGKPFGVCHMCVYFSGRSKGGYCNLLSENLTVLDAEKICHEQVQA